MIRKAINDYAPKCVIPTCTNRVKYRRIFVKSDDLWSAQWHMYCGQHNKSSKQAKIEFLRDYGPCRHCGFDNIMCFTVDHIDGNRFNNDESNLQILCANCHQIKTAVNRDHIHMGYQYYNTNFDSLFYEE